MVYTTPRQSIDKTGGSTNIAPYVQVTRTALNNKKCTLNPTKSTNAPKGGVPNAETRNIIDITLPALCCASATGKFLKVVSTKKADAMLLKGKMAQ
mmetsp:Transcript_68057/g.107965  ORF Transcript_68057/g.107965 Transcript_68057/m.107965 type:complete len:96 (+) Transcript_68057:418-705(+)|eukprot:CAMPEP_0169175622 /NCGR_PEP_ID=MMETSP1015-20121227/65399_1 /TAXON_ID=342587 /ORGANISM="Karlodinium micrum, Strain CCMP2283" /LENGTH=95 /DNA_ID=CAMNT_0009250003 /DNA_START=231 /DNA_END=518 /DNA_ORIENTATION=-